MKTFTAAYPGTCAACPDPIDVDDLLTYDDDDVVVHADCSRRSRAKSKTPHVICPRCFTEVPLSGVCGVCDG